MSDDHIEELLRLAGPRHAVPTDRMRRVKDDVRTEWRRQIRARSRNATIAWSIGTLAAATVVLTVVRLTVPDAAVNSPRQPFATIESLTDGVRMEGQNVDTTSGGRAALRFADGAAVRVDRGTRLRLMSGSALMLEEGAVYIDSGGDRGSLEIHTRLGVLRDIGTRFEVRLGAAALRIRVRDGLVELRHDRDSHQAKRGDELTVDATGKVARRSVPVFGSDWEWAVTVAPPVAIEGRTLREFLDWICEENGWQVQFQNPGVEQKAAAAVLHGSVLGLAPSEALAAILPASGVVYQLENGLLLVLSPGGSRN